MDGRSAQSKFNHAHVFLGADHERNEKRTWAVIWLCGVMMVVEIGGGLAFGSVALTADGLHMSTHAGALFLAAMAYRYARKHANDDRFTFGAGKIGDLAGFASAIILAMISLLIAYEALMRFFAPVPINFGQAIAIASLGLMVNVASVWILSGGGHHHGHSHEHEHEHHARGHDNNMRAAFVHVLADAAVSLLVIIGLGLAWALGWPWIDPVVGMAGAVVVANWAYGLLRDAGAILLDVNPDKRATERIRRVIEENGDKVADLHLWRLGPGHLGAIVEIESGEPRGSDFYREKLAHVSALSHLTIEMRVA